MKKNNFWSSASRDGLFFGLSMFIVLLLGAAFRLEMDYAAIFSIFSFIVIIANVYFYARKYSLQAPEDEGFKVSQSISYILAMALFAGFIYGVGQFLMWNFIAPDYYAEMMDLSFTAIDPDLVTDDAVAILNKATKNPMVFVFAGVFNMLVYSCFVGIFVSVLVKRPAKIEKLDDNE